MAKIMMTSVTTIQEQTAPATFDSVSAIKLISGTSYQTPPMTWLVPVAHQTHLPETYYALTSVGGLVTSAYNASHGSTGPLSAVVDSGVISNAFGITPSKLFFYHQSISGLYRIAMFNACTGVSTNTASALLARATWVYLGQPGYFDPNQNISARAVFNMDGTPIGQNGTSANGMVYFGW